MSADDISVRVIDTADYALLVTVDKQGVADMRADGVSQEQAAEWMRMLCDKFEQKVGTKPDGSFAADTIHSLKELVRRLVGEQINERAGLAVTPRTDAENALLRSVLESKP